MAKKKSETPAPLQFEADGVTYRFVYPKIEVDKVVYTAEDLCAAKEGSEELKVLAHLVSIGSGCIEVVEPKQED